jgi:hypothetical protein
MYCGDGKGKQECNRKLSTLIFGIFLFCRSQWPRGLRHEPSSPARRLGIMCSNPTRQMDVFVRLFCVCVVLCVGSGLAMSWSPSNESYRLCLGFRNSKSGEGPTKGCRAIEREREFVFYIVLWLMELSKKKTVMSQMGKVCTRLLQYVQGI